MTIRGIAAIASSVATKWPPMTAASWGPPNSEMSAPAAKIRSPPVTTTAPGGSACRSSATAFSWREQRGRQRVDLRVVERDDGDAVVTSFDVDQFGFVGHAAGE